MGLRIVVAIALVGSLAAGCQWLSDRSERSHAEKMIDTVRSGELSRWQALAEDEEYLDDDFGDELLACKFDWAHAEQESHDDQAFDEDSHMRTVRVHDHTYVFRAGDARMEVRFTTVDGALRGWPACAAPEP